MDRDIGTFCADGDIPAPAGTFQYRRGQSTPPGTEFQSPNAHPVPARNNTHPAAQNVPGGRPCGCGLRGCLERYSAGTALGVNGWELAQFRPGYAARIIELSGGDPEHISGKAVTAAAREGDPAALECYEQLTHWLGVGLADMCALLDPEVIVIAGGLAEAGDILLAPTRKAFAENLTAGTHRPAIPVVLAEGGQEAGLVGAADLARQP